MEEMRTLNVIESLIMMILMPAIPMIVVGITWLFSLGGFDFLIVMRSFPMIGLVGILSLLGVIAGLSSISDNWS
tara:strand:+ start:3644 stop:3865 length:222 start_codon:yes stop_codon:yes gene_type:complete